MVKFATLKRSLCARPATPRACVEGYPQIRYWKIHPKHITGPYYTIANQHHPCVVQASAFARAPSPTTRRALLWTQTFAVHFESGGHFCLERLRAPPLPFPGAAHSHRARLRAIYHLYWKVPPGGGGATPPCVNPKLGSRVVGRDVTRQCAGSVSLRVSTTLSPSRRPTPKLLPASPNPLPFACPPLKEALALFRSSNGWSFTCVQNPRSPSGAPPDTGSVGVAAAVDTYPAALTILCIF